MAPNRITRGGATPRALLAVALLACAAALLGGCGGGSSSGATGAATGALADLPPPKPSPEESADADLLDSILGRQEAAVDAFAATIPRLSPPNARLAACFRRQEQEHVDGVMKVLRGLKSPADPAPETIDLGDAKDERERLVFLYEVESATIEAELSAISKLESDAARVLLTSTAANQAQHLALLRQALGAGPIGAIPTPFENGAFPPPVG
jgi:hypothetical protein